MRFAIDESGSFTTTSTDPFPPVSVSVALVVPDDERVGLLASFQVFRSTLAAEEFKDGEPKGGKLRPASKLRYCEMLACHPRVLVCPAIVDLGHFPDQAAGALRDGLSQDVKELSHRTTGNDNESLASVSAKIAELSPPQAVRLYAWARAFFHALHHAIRLPDVSDSLLEWDHRDFFIDPVQTTPNNAEAIILGEMLALWMACWSSVTDDRQSWAFAVPDETECLHHSFRHRFYNDDRIDLDALLSGHVRLDRTSRDEELLQVVDIAASIVYQAARKPEAGSDAVAIYESLMRSCPYEPHFGIELVTPHHTLAGSGAAHRFAALFAAIQQSNQTHC